MASSEEFLFYLLDMLEELGPVNARAMFGGHGIYLKGLICAILVEGVLYIKSDPLNRTQIEARGLPQFAYMRKGKACHLSYFMVPEEALDAPEVLRFWVQQGYDAALRAQSKSRK